MIIKRPVKKDLPFNLDIKVHNVFVCMRMSEIEIKSRKTIYEAIPSNFVLGLNFSFFNNFDNCILIQ